MVLAGPNSNYFKQLEHFHLSMQTVCSNIHEDDVGEQWEQRPSFGSWSCLALGRAGAHLDLWIIRWWVEGRKHEWALADICAKTAQPTCTSMYFKHRISLTRYQEVMRHFPRQAEDEAQRPIQLPAKILARSSGKAHAFTFRIWNCYSLSSFRN